MYYVTMTDKFMSGWGQAHGKINKMVVECDTYEEAAQIERGPSAQRNAPREHPHQQALLRQPRADLVEGLWRPVRPVEAGLIVRHTYRAARRPRQWLQDAFALALGLVIGLALVYAL